MPASITESDSYDASVIYPLTGETYTQTAELGFLQPLANRTNFLDKSLYGLRGYNSVTPSSAWTSVTSPQSTASGDVPGILTPVQALANRTKYIEDRVLGVGALLTQSIGMTPLNSPTGWTWSSTAGAGAVVWVQSNVASAVEFWVALSPPINKVGATINRVILSVIGDLAGGGAHGGVLPTAKVKLALIQQTFANAAFTVVNETTDTSGTAATYEAIHTFATATVSHTLVDGSAYYVRVRGETGGSAIANALAIQTILVEWART